jgi:hypothetical protein
MPLLVLGASADLHLVETMFKCKFESYLRSHSFLWVAGNFGKARGTNKGHGLLLNSGGNLLFDEIDQPLLNPSLRFEAQMPIDLRGGCDVLVTQ